MQELLVEFAGDHQITYTPVYCSSFAEMEAAIEEGRADLMLASNQRDLTGYKYVAKAGVRNQFFAVSKDHPELMEQLEEQIRENLYKLQGGTKAKQAAKAAQKAVSVSADDFDDED